MTEYQETLAMDILVGDSMFGGYCYEDSIGADIKVGISSVDPFNFSEWERENKNPRTIYTAKLEQPDGTVLLDLNLKNFNAKLNKDSKNYLSIVCANEDDFSSIKSWIAAGSVFVVLRKALTINGVESLSEIIARVECDTPRLDKGSTSSSVSLSGYWSESFSPKNISLPSPSIKRSVGGRFMMTFSEPHLYLRPGDTVSVPEEVDFIVSSVSYSANESNISMTISEEKI